jgi:hypothetical protein
MLNDVSPQDSVTLVAASVVLTAVTAFAGLLRRIGRLQSALFRSIGLSRTYQRLSENIRSRKWSGAVRK